MLGGSLKGSCAQTRFPEERPQVSYEPRPPSLWQHLTGHKLVQILWVCPFVFSLTLLSTGDAVLVLW